MAMEINSVYGNYASSYANQKETKQVKDSKSTSEAAKTEGQASSVGNTKQTGSTRKTASDELTYLAKKYDGYSFVSANFQPGMRYGSKDKVNVAISPTFLKKMANNPELEAEYEKEIANMKACDESKVRNIEGQGDRIIAKGWAIDKDGNISSWTIGERGHRPKVVSPNEYGEKIRKQKAEKKKAEDKIAAKKKEKAEQKEALEEKRKASREEQEALKEKIDSDNRALLGDKYKGSEWFDASEDIILETADKNTNIGSVVGLNLDMKL